MCDEIYPYVGKHEKGMIVMFTDEKTGMLLNDCSAVDEALNDYFYCEDWIEGEFERIGVPVIMIDERKK
jgi:ribosome maturation factor RimP